MKKLILICLLTVLSLYIVSIETDASSGGVPFGIKKKKQEKPETPTSLQVTPQPQKQKSTPRQLKKAPVSKQDLARERARIQKKRVEINNTEWAVELIPLSGRGRKKKDVILFSDRRVSMKSLSKQGFSPTNFSLSIRNNGKIVWETMQKYEHDIVFFKGEVSPDLQDMRGVISFQKLEGTSDYSFVSTLKREVIPE